MLFEREEISYPSGNKSRLEFIHVLFDLMYALPCVASQLNWQRLLWKTLERLEHEEFLLLSDDEEMRLSLRWEDVLLEYLLLHFLLLH